MSPPIPAMILAAGRGERMRPLTDDYPKPLLKVHGQALIDWHVLALARGGFHELVVNTAWLGDQISSHLDRLRTPDTHRQLLISYSHEGDDFGYALETAGGIARALPLLGEVFWLLAADVYAPGFAFTPEAVSRFMATDKLAHLWLVPNPPHNRPGQMQDHRPRRQFRRGVHPHVPAKNRRICLIPGKPDGCKPLTFSYSHEGVDFGGALETAGGIARALPLLGEVFWVVAADVFVPGFAFTEAAVARFAASSQLAHLWLVPNPPHNPRGDFGLGADGLALNLPRSSAEPQFTFSTIALYRREFFDSLPAGNPQGLKAQLAPLLRRAMDNRRVGAELYTGRWTDVGTPARLAELNAITNGTP